MYVCDTDFLPVLWFEQRHKGIELKQERSLLWVLYKKCVYVRNEWKKKHTQLKVMKFKM